MSTAEDAPVEQIAGTKRAGRSGKLWIDPKTAGALVAGGNVRKNISVAASPSKMEAQTLALIQAGLSNQEIITRLNTTTETIALVMHNIIQRLLKKTASIDVSEHSKSQHTEELLTGSDDSLTEGKVFIDKYVIENLIGSGSLGAVFKAKHLFMHRYVALKLLRPEVCSDRLSIRYFKQEAMAIASLQHKNIVTVHDFGISKEHVPYLIMEFANGTNLAAILDKEHRLPLHRIINICLQVCAGLSQAHSRGIVHCDLKPSNILMLGSGPEETVKIVDFGLAQILPLKVTKKSQSPEQFLVNGTPLYMSPEQCMGSHIDGRSDIYSLGCILHEALTGVSIFEGETPADTLINQVNMVPPPLSAILSEAVSAKLDACLSSMLAKDPAARPQSMDETTRLLLSAAHSDAI